MIQSKLDFEVNKTANDSQKNNKVDKKGDKKKKNKPMSLDKFLHNGEKNGKFLSDDLKAGEYLNTFFYYAMNIIG